MLVSSGCRRETQTTASSIYGEIEKEFVLGNLPTALEHSNQASRRFEVSSPHWAATFRLESAKILIWQGDNRDAFTLLQKTLPENSSTELAVRRKALLSIAQARLGHLDQAEVIVLEAARECLPNLSLCAEVSGARGTINMERQDFDEADRQFQASLSNARLTKDHFLQTQALLNLGRVAMIEEHYEDALARFRETSALAKSLDAKLLLEKVTGNLGWIYYKTGDFPRALDNYREAEKQATELGVPKDQVLWLNNVGQSEYRLGDFDAARLSYERSLRLAQSIQDQNEILVLHVDLGYLLLLHLNDLNAAEGHIREATRLAKLRKNNRSQLNPLLLQALLLDAKGNKESAIKALLEFDKHGAELPSVQWEAENNLARIYSEIGQRADADRWFRQSIDTFQHSRESLSSVDSALPFLSNGAELYETYSEHLIDQHKIGEALSVIDQSRAESLEDGLHLSRPGQKSRSTPLNAPSIAARLQATILVYSLRPKISYLWAITPTSQQFYQLAGNETILPLIQLHTQMILASKDLLSQPTAPGRSSL